MTVSSKYVRKYGKDKRNCIICGKEFIFKTSYHKFCSSKCSIQNAKNKYQISKKNSKLELRFNILVRDNFTCQYCGRSPRNTIGVILHVDHIIPRSLGGLSILSNLITSCEDCNQGKSNKDIIGETFTLLRSKT